MLAGTPNFLAKYVNGADVGNSGVFEAADNSIGLGTTTPFDRLHIRYDNNTGDFTGLAVQNTNGGALAYSGMLFYDHTNALTQFQGYNNSTHEYRINNIAKSGGQFDSSINFMIGGTSRLFVGSNGNIGIGTSTPGAALDVSRTGSLFVAATSYPTALNDAPFFVTRVAYGSPSLPAAVSVGNLLGVFGAIGYDGTQFSAVQAGMSALAAENWTHTTRGSALMFATTPVGAMDAAIAQMSILPNGNVGIGTPRNPVSGLPTATDKLQVVGDIRVGTTGTNGCIKDFSGTGIVGTCSSDRRLKKNITPFGPTLDKVTALQPVHYFWRVREFPGRHFGDSQAAGLIAQEVERVLPELVETDSDGYKAVNYSQLPLLTIQAVKELKAENDALKQRVAELERLDPQALTHRIAELERLVGVLLTAARR